MNKPGHLSVRWSRKRDDTGPGTIGAKLGYADQGDLSYAWGRGCSKADGGFLDMCFHWKDAGYGRTFAEELHARGYDLQTLKFSIQKRAVEPATSAGARLAEAEQGMAIGSAEETSSSSITVPEVSA